jgi:hypothetical protein
MTLVQRNALRLTHECFKADAQGPIKTPEDALAEVEGRGARSRERDFD